MASTTCQAQLQIQIQHSVLHFHPQSPLKLGFGRRATAGNDEVPTTWERLTEPLSKTRASASDQSAVLGGDQRLSLSGGYRSFISSSGTAAALGGADCDRTSPERASE